LITVPVTSYQALQQSGFGEEAKKFEYCAAVKED
jgi:hypothetical protein